MNEKLEVVNGSTGNSKTLLSEIQNMRSAGEVSTDEFVSKMRKLEVLLGVSQISPFGTNELEIFEEDLRNMSMSDMQKLATKVGINPYHNKPALKSNLLKEFNAQTKNSRRNIMPTSVNSFVPDMDNPKHQNLIKILGDI
jgi:hypothetical protein